MRPLLAAAQAASDRLASEVRALGGALDEPSARSLRESLRALHTALGQLHGVHGGVSRASLRARVDALHVVCAAAEAAQLEGVEVEVSARGAAGELEVDEGALQRLLRWLIDRATTSGSGAVRVGVWGEGDEVVIELPWHDELAAEVADHERAWLERAATELAGGLRFDDGRVQLRLARDLARPLDSSPDELARELTTLRRERVTHTQEVERATCALHSAQLEVEAARRQLAHVERSALSAAGDLQRTFESIEAMAAIVADPEGLGGDLTVVAQSGLARVMELVAEVDTAAMRTAHSLAPPWRDEGIEDPAAPALDDDFHSERADTRPERAPARRS